MFDANPVVDSMTVPPLPLGSFAETVKCRCPPTVAFCGPGTTITGRTYDATTVMITYTWAEETPSVTVKLAPDGNWLAERVRLGVGTEDSVPVTVNVRVDV